MIRWFGSHLHSVTCGFFLSIPFPQRLRSIHTKRMAERDSSVGEENGNNGVTLNAKSKSKLKEADNEEEEDEDDDSEDQGENEDEEDEGSGRKKVKMCEVEVRARFLV